MKNFLDINNNFISNSIRNKILVPMLLLSLIPIFIFGIVFLNNSYVDLEEKKIIELQNSLQLKNDKLQLIFELIDRELKLIIADTNYSNEILTSNNNIVKSDFESKINYFIDAEPAVSAVRVIDSFGDVVLNYEPNIDHDSSIEFRNFLSNYLQTDLSEVYYSKVFSDIHNHKSMFVAYPEHKFGSDSIVLLTIDLDYVYSVILDQSALGSTGEILLGQQVGEHAQFIHHLKYEPLEGFPDEIYLTEARALPIRESVQGISGCGPTIDYRFEPILACWGPTSFLDWGIVAKIDQKEVFVTLNFNILLFLIILFSTSILIVIFSHMVAKGIQNPILELQRTFKDFNGGKYDSVIKIKSHDEVADLTKSFQTFQEFFVTNNKIKLFYQKELELKLEELKKTDVLKDEFSSMVTHELKTPLTPIRGYCEMLKENSLGKLTPEQLDCIETIDVNAFHLEQLIGDILDAQKLDMGHIVFNKNKISLSSFITELTKSVQPLINKKNLQFIVTPMADCNIFSDEQRLKQVFYNLIRNSVDFVPEKTGLIEIGFTIYDTDVIFYVKDNGVGIPKDKQSHIFKKFYQVDTAQTRKHGGTGLGLVICKGMVEGLGGKIWFESIENEGTTFYFSIPMVTAVSVEVP